VYAIDATDFCVRLMPSILLTSLNMRRGNLLYNDDTTKIPLVAQSQCTLSNKISVGCRMVIIPRVLGWLENNFCIKHPCFLHIVYVYMLGCIKIFVSLPKIMGVQLNTHEPLYLRPGKSCCKVFYSSCQFTDSRALCVTQ
jgi:hypothetical protein